MSIDMTWSKGRWCFSTYCCFISFFIFQFTRYSVASETLELKQLSSQIDALILQRQDDFNKLEAIARNSLNKDAEIDQLRNEIRDLKLELDSLKAKSSSADCTDGANNGEGGGGCSNRMKNEQLTVEWLSNSISEIRAEIGEMAKWFNSTIALQQRQSFSTDISILQNDVVSLRHDAEHLKADKAKYDAKLSAVGLDVDGVKQSTSSVAAKLVNLTQQIRVLSTYVYDFSSTMKLSKRKHLAVFKKMMVLNENPLKMQVYTTTRRRRRMNRHKSKINERSRDYEDDHVNLVRRETRSGSFTPQEPLPPQPSSTMSKQDKVELEKRVRKLENSMKEATYRSKEQEKLRSSMLELLESVETLEAKFDNVTPVLKKEISKLEFSMAQIVANLSIAREQQENDRILVTTMTENLLDTRSKLAHYEQLSVLNQEKVSDNASTLSFISWSHLIDNIVQQQNSTQYSQDDDSIPISKPISTLSQLFSSLFNQYAAFLRRLPKSCDEIDGESDLYLLSIDDTTPILVFCERKSNDLGTDIVSSNSSNSYIVIQRRTNGRMDFNKNWQEYAHGFGNLRGEFWLGNEIIHRLTKNNDTGLRIELEDVLGRHWYAEYSTFNVASSQRSFELHVDGFSGNATDAFQYHNRMQFSTKDADHDKSEMNCAADYESGWWFSHCQRTNLNAKYNLGLTWFDSDRNEWISISSTKMMLTKRKTQFSQQSRQ